MSTEQELTFVNEQEQHTTTPQVHILDEHFYSPELQTQRRVWLYLPADYDTSGKSYPVIYMQDGQNLFDQYTASYQEWGVDEIMDERFAGQACIIVAVDHGEENRITEYNPYDSEHGPGRGDDYVSFLTHTLKPYIDDNYRTVADARHTAIVGSSMGGLIAMYAALKHPEVFGNAGIFSPAFWIAKDIYAYALEQENLTESRFYFVCGDAESDDMVGDMQGMADIVSSKMTDNSQQLMVQIVPGAGHNEQQWHDDFPAFYEWLQAGF